MLLKALTSINNVEILNSFDPEIQLKDTESVIKSKLNRIIDLIKRF